MKRMILKFAPAATACLLAACHVANAALTIISDSVGGGDLAGAHLVNFDNLTLGPNGGTATGPNGSVGVQFVPDGQSVAGAESGVYAMPYMSGANDLNFNSSTLYGQDPTTYLTTGTGQAILTFPGSEQYLGILWGSVDTYNTLSFYNGNGGLIGSLTGSQVIAGANGDQGITGTVYVNLWSDTAFSKVIATSSSYAFEFDDVAYSAVPEPAAITAAALLLVLPLGASVQRILRKRHM